MRRPNAVLSALLLFAFALTVAAAPDDSSPGGLGQAEAEVSGGGIGSGGASRAIYPTDRFRDAFSGIVQQMRFNMWGGERIGSATASLRTQREAAEAALSEIGTGAGPPLLGPEGGTDVRANQDTGAARQNETSIDVNPRNRANVLGSANDYRNGDAKAGFYSSSDRGQSFQDGLVPEPTYPVQGDPAVCFDADGAAYYSFISFNRIDDSGGLFVARSSDGGRSWPQVVALESHPKGGDFEDKPYIACDTTTGSHRNSVYVSTLSRLRQPGDPPASIHRRRADLGRLEACGRRGARAGAGVGASNRTKRRGVRRLGGPRACGQPDTLRQVHRRRHDLRT